MAECLKSYYLTKEEGLTTQYSGRKPKKKTTKLSKKILTYFLLSAVADERKKEVIPDVYDADDCRRLPSQLGSRRFFQRPKYR